MAQSLNTLLHDISVHAQRLGEINQAQRIRIAELEQEVELLKGSLAEKEKELQRALTDAEFLTMSHRLADSPDTIISTRRQIARLIRNIDNCISMLKEE
ncbi:MAG: hypothetical protein K2J87_01775 [Muribaculaceae bacterium]|nr:hypothetical protein [Muribaculaceae bacterium]